MTDSSVTFQTLLKDCETPSTKSIHCLTIVLLTPTKKIVENVETNSSEKNMDTITQYVKIKVKSFKENILQNLRNNIKEIFDSEFTIFKSKCEELVQTSSVRYNKQIDHLQNELKTKDKIIDQLLKSLSSLTNSELESKNNIIHKLLDQTNDEEKKKSIQRQNDINTKSDIADNKSDEKYSNKKTKEHAERNKANNSPNNTESRDVKPKTNKGKKIRVEILVDSMLNGVQEKGLNKNADINIKIRKYPGASSTDILDHIRPSLRKEPDQIIIHAGTNDLTNDHNYLNNVKKIVKMVRETCKNTKLCFSSLICRNDLKDIDEKVKKTNTHLENYCKQQNLGFIDNSNLKRSDLNSRGLHLQERGSSKLAKNLLDCATDNGFADRSEQSKFYIAKELRNNKLSHPKCVSVTYLNINSVRNKFSSIPHLIDNKVDIFAIAETKLNFSFPESQFILPAMRKPFRIDVTSRKGGLLVFVKNDIPRKYLRSFHLLGDIQAIPLEINLKSASYLSLNINLQIKT